MEKLTIDNNIKVFGIQVKTFPAGIGKAFDELIEKTGDPAGERDYYGISYMDDKGGMVYTAVAAEKTLGEAEKFGYPVTMIEKGKYLFSILQNWQSQTNCIKDIFHKMVQENDADTTKPCIEWYKNGEEMLCLVKAK